jgi:hypothetical protein
MSMNSYDIGTPSLHAICDAAQHFGLTREEVWQTVDASPPIGGDATVAAYLDEVAGALAVQILAKERRILSMRQRDLSAD